MGYIPIELITKSYMTLSMLTSDHKQGQTQITSAIRHLVAFDKFYKEHHDNCDLSKQYNREEFVENVRDVVNVSGDKYTTNFYTSIKSLYDCGVGSNFFSAGVVNNSKQNVSTLYDYPTRGQNPLFKVRDNTLIREVYYYSNVRSYLKTEELRCAFAVWLLRKTIISELTAKEIKKHLCSFLTVELVEALMPEEKDLNMFIGGFKLQQNIAKLSENNLLNTSLRKSVVNPSPSKYLPYLTAIRTKPFILLAGISGTGKSRIVREFAFKSCPKYLQDKNGTTPGNYCMIEVKPNWHDSTELLGYYSRLGKAAYQFKKFVKFLVKAKMYPDVPFFVCLDEMNLAPVEQYFAEILSILETRKHPRNVETGHADMNSVKTEVIIEANHFRELTPASILKYSDDDNNNRMGLTDREIYLKLFDINTREAIEREMIDNEVGKRHDLTTEGLTLPDNVVIIGTVNMDDTTHQFSRKVIDRAMTIEMNGGNLRDMFGGSKNLEYMPDEEQQKWQEAFTRRYVTADEVLEAHPDVAGQLMEMLPERLDEINKALKGTPFEVSYRVLNELTIMVGVMLDDNEDGKSLDDIVNLAVNNILLMKILPRIEGDAEMFALSNDYKKKAGVSYSDRLEWLRDLAPDLQVIQEEEDAEKSTTDGDDDEAEETAKAAVWQEHPQTAKEKIQEMIDRLGNQDFTRFWP